MVFYQEKKGIIFARNFGCKQAKGEYIAVMDADDISLPARFETQIKFMEKYPDIGIVGTWADVIEENGIMLRTRCQGPTNHFAIGWHLIFCNCMAHLTIMIRSEVLKRLNYYSQADNGFPEDYDLWTRAFFITKIANIPKPLAKYRVHKSNNSLLVSLEMKQFDIQIQHTMVKKILGEFSHPFFDELLVKENSSIFSFNPNVNDIQVNLIETLYRHYINTYSTSNSENKEIRTQISLIFLSYSWRMFQFSKIKSWSLLNKYLHYLQITNMKKMICMIGQKTIVIFSNEQNKTS